MEEQATSYGLRSCQRVTALTFTARNRGLPTCGRGASDVGPEVRPLSWGSEMAVVIVVTYPATEPAHLAPSYSVTQKVHINGRNKDG